MARFKATSDRQPRLSRRAILGGLFLLGLIHGLVYIFLVPPWQHNDEPGHFEFAWLIANRDEFPQRGDFDEEFRLALSASMRAHGFFEDLSQQPPERDALDRPWIGVAQIDRYDLFYRLNALPLSWLRGQPLELQLVACRLLSLLLFLLTLGVSVLILEEISLSSSPLRWMVPAALALTPGFVDLMTSMNSDVLATLGFSMFIWAMLRLINGKRKAIDLVLLGASLVVCVWTKPTSAPAVLFAFLPPVYYLLRRAPKPAMILVGVLVIGSCLAVLRLDDAAGWLRDTGQEGPTRASNRQAVWGDQAISLHNSTQANDHSQILQIIPPDQVAGLRGHTITVGAWIWADQPGEARTPAIVINHEHFQSALAASTTPEFYALSVKVPQDAWRMLVVLNPGASGATIAPNTLYYDGVVLVRGEFGSQPPPIFHSAEALAGNWGQHNFTNLLQNGSAEYAGPRLLAWVDQLLSKVYPGRVSMIFSSLANLKQVAWFLDYSLLSLFNTFWGRFGWGQVAFLGDPWPYRILWGVSLVGIAGGVAGLWRTRKQLAPEIPAFLAITTLFIWTSVWLRGIPTLGTNLFFPGARYAAVVIVPGMAFLINGWRVSLSLVEKTIQVNPNIKIALFFCFFLTMDVLAIASIWRYY